MYIIPHIVFFVFLVFLFLHLVFGIFWGVPHLHLSPSPRQVPSGWQPGLEARFKPQATGLDTRMGHPAAPGALLPAMVLGALCCIFTPVPPPPRRLHSPPLSDGA